MASQEQFRQLYRKLVAAEGSPAIDGPNTQIPNLSQRVEVGASNFIIDCAIELADSAIKRQILRAYCDSRSPKELEAVIAQEKKFGSEFVVRLKEAVFAKLQTGDYVNSDRGGFEAEFGLEVRDSLEEWLNVDGENEKRRMIDRRVGKIIAINALGNSRVKVAFERDNLRVEHVFGEGNISDDPESLRLRTAFVLEQIGYHAGVEAAHEVVRTAIDYVNIGGVKDESLKGDILARLAHFDNPEVLRNLMESAVNA